MNSVLSAPGFQPSTFSSGLARFCVLASKAAYGPDFPGKIIRDSAHDVVVCLERFGDHKVLLSFRGTTDMRNWLTDLDAWKTLPEWAGGAEIHAGFHAAIDYVWNDLLAELRAADRLILTGHSLGGALAMLAAWRLRDQVDAVYTFGQPRVGNRFWPVIYNYSPVGSRTWRIVHRRDIVPHVPWMLGSYHHAGHEAWYETDGPHSLMVDRTFAQYAAGDISATLDVWFHPAHIETWLADHHVDKYVKLFPRLTNIEKTCKQAAL